MDNEEKIQKVVNSLHKKAEVINRREATKKFIEKASLITMIVLILVFGSFFLAQKNAGFFQVKIGEGNAAITMSETADFNKTSSNLYVPFPNRFSNMSYTDIPVDEIGNEDGQCNGEDYMAYTFYLRNESKSDIYYEREMPILGTSLQLDQVVRIMIVRTDTNTNETSYNYYAKAKEQTDNEAEQLYYYDTEEDLRHAKFQELIMTEPFASKDIVFNEEIRNMKPGQVDKYSIIIWIEGSDKQCTDSRRGGEIKLNLKFNAYLEEDYEENHEE